MEMASWLRDLAARQWFDLGEGSDAAADVERHRVTPADAGPKERGSQEWSVSGTATGSTAVIQPCTDGGYVYYLGGTAQAYIVAANPATGAEVYEANDIGVGLSAICSDGGYVYVQTVDSGFKGIYRMLRTDGTQDGSTTTPTYYSCDRLVANGAYCVGISPSGNPGYAVFYSSIQQTIAEDGIVATGSAGLNAVAIDSDQCYVGGTRNYDVWAFTLSTRAYAWGGGVLGWTAPTSSAITVQGIAADGNRVYVASDRQALSAGGSANLFCVDRVSGQTLWSFDVAVPGALTALDLEGIAVDDQYLYVVDDQDDLHIIDITGPTPSQAAYVANFGDPCCDGVSVFGNTEVTTQLQRLWSAGAYKTFMRSTITNNPHRRPFYTRSLPADTRI
jgi:hypothetical protein